MSLKHTLLGFLHYRPMTGHELKESFDTSVRHMWHASLSQIHPTLTQMQREGLVNMRVQYEGDQSNNKVYYVTEPGRQEFRRWLLAPMDPQPVRIPFLIKVFFGGTLKNAEMLALFRHNLRSHQERLAMLTGPQRENIERNIIGENGLKRDGFFWEMALESGIAYEKTIIEWMKECINKIEAMPDKETED